MQNARDLKKWLDDRSRISVLADKITILTYFAGSFIMSVHRLLVAIHLKSATGACEVSPGSIQIWIRK